MQPEGAALDPGLVGRNLAGARKRASLTQSELAERVGISRATLIAVKNGQRLPNQTVLVAIADTHSTFASVTSSRCRQRTKKRSCDFVALSVVMIPFGQPSTRSSSSGSMSYSSKVKRQENRRGAVFQPFR